MRPIAGINGLNYTYIHNVPLLWGWSLLKINLITSPTSFYAAELAQKARREIADYISNGKDERARIRVSVCNSEMLKIKFK